MESLSRTYAEERYRSPGPFEQAMELWVDRTGEGAGGGGEHGLLRMLGLFAAVAVESGRGTFFSPSSGPLPARQGDVILLFPDEPARYVPDPSWRTCWVVWQWRRDA